MARALAALLGRENDKLFTVATQDLEKATGQHGIDNRLMGDIFRKAHKVIRELGLDGADTTAKELYQALRVSDVDLQGLEYVGLVLEGHCVSFHTKDIQYDDEHHVVFENRHLTYFRNALAQEIAERYKKASKHPKITERLIAVITKNTKGEKQ